MGRKESGHNCWLPGRWLALEVLELEAGNAVWDNTAAPGRWQPAEKHADAPQPARAPHQHLPTARRASTRPSSRRWGLLSYCAASLATVRLTNGVSDRYEAHIRPQIRMAATTCFMSSEGFCGGYKLYICGCV